MRSATLTFKSIRARPVVLKLKRSVIARIATITDWPLILIDLFTNEGVVGRSYLEPYTAKAMKYLVPALHDLGDMLKGRELAPVELYELARKSLHFVGYQGPVHDRRLGARPRPHGTLERKQRTSRYVYILVARSARSGRTIVMDYG